MNKVTKLLSLLSAPILVSTFCTSCGKNSITITIDGGIGIYEDESFIKSFSVKKGTRLDDCKFEAPILNYYTLENDIYGDSVTRPVLYYTTKDGKVYNNTPIKSNTVLYAHYYESFSKEQQITKETITEIYQIIHEFRPEWTHIDEAYNQAINKIDLSTSIYQLCSYKYCYGTFIGAMGQIQPERAPFVANVFNHFVDKVEDIKDDQRPISIGKSVTGFCSTVVMRPGDEWLSDFKTIIDIQLKYIDKIDPNCASYYGVPFDALVRACGQQPLLMDLDDSFELFCDSYTKIHDISEGKGLAKPLVGMCAMGVLRPQLVSKCNELYAQIVQDILNN